MLCWGIFNFGNYFLLILEFGVFVNNLGRRSRQGDLKWHGLPLAFGMMMCNMSISLY